MSWNNFLKERESLHFGGEMYKSAVIRYLQLQGYCLKTTSSQEGNYPDLVFEKKNQADFWVETKATKVSIFEKNFRSEILKYFCEWLKLPRKERFLFCFFIEDLTRKNEVKKILTREAIEKETISWYNERLKIDVSEKCTKLLDKASYKEIIEFLHSTSINIVGGYELELLVRMREKELNRTPNIKAAKLLQEVAKRQAPIRERTDILINFMELSYPVKYWEVESKYKSKDYIYKKCEEKKVERLPVITLTESDEEIPIIRSFDEDLLLLKPFIKGTPKEKPIKDLENENIREMLYEHVKRWLWCKGLRRYKSDYFFPYKNLDPKLGERENPPFKIILGKRKKVVTKPRFKNGSLNFVEHRAVSIKIGTINKVFGIFIWPKFIFTNDGINRIEGKNASRIIMKYRNPIYSRNLNKRTELKFWENFLIKSNFVREKDKWFRTFWLKPLKEKKIRWSSKAMDLKLRRITDFMK